MGPVCGRLDQGRIHFQHGPIDLVIFALGESAVIEEAHAKAWARFGQILPELVAELPDLRQALDPRVQCGMLGHVERLSSIRARLHHADGGRGRIRLG